MWRDAIRRSCIVFVAMDEDGVAGFGSAGPQRTPTLPQGGEIYALYLLSRAQGRGFGRALMAALAGDLIATGFRDASLWVIDGNARAARFYIGLGGRVMAHKQFAIDGAPIFETAYVWDDLSTLLPR